MSKTINIFAALIICVLLGACAKAEYAGHYEGVLPAADAPGMQTNLTLNPDNSFTLTTIYAGHEDNVFTEEGTYTVNANGIIALNDKDDGLQYFKPQSDGTLIVLTVDGQEVEGPLKDYYKLKKTQAF